MTETVAAAHEVFLRQALQSGKRVPVLWGFGAARMYPSMAAMHTQGAGIGEFGTAMSGVSQTTDDKQAETLPYSMRYITCGGQAKCPAHKFKGECWVDRPDFKPEVKQGAVGGRASWHPGWREHRLRGRVMAFTFLKAIDEALDDWQKQTIGGAMPLPSESWHLSASYDKVRTNLKSYTGVCEKAFSDFIPRMCALPFRGKSEHTPRAHPLDDGILRYIVSAEGNTDIPVYTQPVYNAPDVPAPWLQTPAGQVDVANIVSQRQCPGITDLGYRNEQVEKLRLWKEATATMPKRRSQVAYPDRPDM